MKEVHNHTFFFMFSYYIIVFLHLYIHTYILHSFIDHQTLILSFIFYMLYYLLEKLLYFVYAFHLSTSNTTFFFLQLINKQANDNNINDSKYNTKYE
jgi:hypothetical protein